VNICVRSSTGRREIGDVGGGGDADADAFGCGPVHVAVGGEWDDKGRCSIITDE
jgi:hypothetical protein